MTIVGPNEAKVNDTIRLECATSNSNPQASLSWILDGRPARENGSRITTSADGGWVSKSNLTTVVRSSEHNLAVSCYAVIEDGQTIITSKTITVVCKSPSSDRTRLAENGLGPKHPSFHWR